MATIKPINQPTADEVNDICRIYEAVMSDTTLAEAFGRLVTHYISPNLMQDIRLCMIDAKINALTQRIAAIETRNNLTNPEN